MLVSRTAGLSIGFRGSVCQVADGVCVVPPTPSSAWAADEAEGAAVGVSLQDLEPRRPQHRLDGARGEAPEPIAVVPIPDELGVEADLLVGAGVSERAARARAE